MHPYLSRISSMNMEKDIHSPSTGVRFTLPCKNKLQKQILQKQIPKSRPYKNISLQKTDLYLIPKVNQTHFAQIFGLGLLSYLQSYTFGAKCLQMELGVRWNFCRNICM